MEAARNGLNNFIEVVVKWLPLFLGALLILLIGWLIAVSVKKVIRRLLSSANLNKRLYASHAGGIIQKAIPDPSNLIASIVYWAILLGAISLAVSVLGIDALTNFVGAIYGYLPNVLAALLIFLVASAVATAVAVLVERSMGGSATGKIVATVVPVLVMSIATFMILEQLGIAPTIIAVTYTALVGSLGLGLALAFGLGGRDVASRLLESAYEMGVNKSDQIKQDVRAGKNRAAESVRKAKDNIVKN